MHSYPAKVAVIVPEFVITAEAPASSTSRPYVFLNGFSILKVERAGRGFRFDETRGIDESGMASVDLLDRLAAEFDEDCSVAGYRLDQVIASLVRVPRDDPRDAKCKPALVQLRSALQNDVHDVHWFADRPAHRSLEALTERYDLPCEWGRPGTGGNPAMLERRLSARAQAIWLMLAIELLPETESRRAQANYDAWRTAHSIA